MDASNKYVHNKIMCFDVSISYLGGMRRIIACRENANKDITNKPHLKITPTLNQLIKTLTATFARNNLLASNVPVSFPFPLGTENRITKLPTDCDELGSYTYLD